MDTIHNLSFDFCIRSLFLVLACPAYVRTSQEPSHNYARNNEKNEEQSAGHRKRPKQKFDIYWNRILDNKYDGKAGKQQRQDHSYSFCGHKSSICLLLHSGGKLPTDHPR